MKETRFYFVLRLFRADSQSILDKAKLTLSSIAGVCSVNSLWSGETVDLNIDVVFEDSSEAKKLHRKVMKALMTCEGIAIENVKTVLTDIF